MHKGNQVEECDECGEMIRSHTFRAEEIWRAHRDEVPYPDMDKADG